MRPIFTQTSILQTSLFSGDPGAAVAPVVGQFNHLNALRQIHALPLELVVDGANPIARIKVAHGSLIDRLAITYNLAAGGIQELSNGSPGGQVDEIIVHTELGEVVSSVSGLVGPHPDFGNRVFLNQISFSIYNRNTGATVVHAYGGVRAQGTPFLVTLPALFAGRVAIADANTTGISALAVIKVGEF